MATKSRFFTGIVYPDGKNVPVDWIDVLRNSLRMYLISPLHKPDPLEDMESGALKTKSDHHHLLYCHGNTISPRVAREIIPEWVVLPPADTAFAVGSYRNLSRYFCHLDQPDKQQWAEKPEEILTVLNGFPLDLKRELTASERLQLKKELHAFVRNNSITEYAELMDSLADAQDWDLFELAFDSQSKIEGYIRSKRQSR
ncbi:MAG: hypothetical protein H9W80_12550 [Enterococcus sp.]|nr:hypothetical protein [Enterococcus sp.]